MGPLYVSVNEVIGKLTANEETVQCWSMFWVFFLQKSVLKQIKNVN